jgi:hypothetical protein
MEPTGESLRREPLPLNHTAFSQSPHLTTPTPSQPKHCTICYSFAPTRIRGLNAGLSTSSVSPPLSHHSLSACTIDGATTRTADVSNSGGRRARRAPWWPQSCPHRTLPKQSLTGPPTWTAAHGTCGLPARTRVVGAAWTRPYTYHTHTSHARSEDGGFLRLGVVHFLRSTCIAGTGRRRPSTTASLRLGWGGASLCATPAPRCVNPPAGLALSS